MNREALSSMKAYLYAYGVVNGEINAGKYIKKQCKEFLYIAEDNHDKYFLDLDEYKMIKNVTKLMNMASGLRSGQTVHDSLAGFQWLFIVAILCIKHRDIPTKRRYETATLLIARKSGKTFLISVIFAILLILSPKYSEFYSVAADGELSRLIKKELDQLISSSPLISKHFRIKRDEVIFNAKESKYKPLNYSTNRLDGRKANVWLCDECGALPERYPISAMQSSQINMENRLGIIISTAYPTLNNPMSEEVEYAEKVLDGIIEDETYFSLLYAPDDKVNWKDNDDIIVQSNPLAVEIPENMDYLYQQRAKAIELASERTNFLTKHLNIFLQSNNEEVYIDIDKWKNCRTDKIDFTGQDVIVGVDLSLTTDLTAISLMFKHDGKYYSKSIGFLPEDSLSDRREKFDYRQAQERGECIITKGSIVDYTEVEKFIRDIEENFNCNIKAIVSDPFNAVNMMQSLAEDYEVIMLKQNYTNLSAPTKELRNEVYTNNFVYEASKLYDWNVGNAITVKDKQENEMLSKANKNKQRIDLIAAAVFAFSQLYLEEDDDWSIQIC